MHSARYWIGLAACIAGLCSSAHAFDTTLHQPSAEGLNVEGVSVVAATAAKSAEGVDVKEVRDLGVKENLVTPEDLWERIRRGFAMPDLDGPLVVERQAWYADRPETMRIMAERSRRYLFHIVQELERRGMPTELALLPMVESAMNPLALSSARASGLWQFIPSTGKHYNLEQNWWYDARRDIVASTNAALDYLQFLHNMHGDWHLALASYNMGEYGVLRAVERNRARGKPTDYESLSMPRETRFYVPKLQALKNIIANPASFGVELPPIADAPYFVTVELTKDIDLSIAATLAEMPVEELIALNPGHNRPLMSSTIAPKIVLPTDRAVVFVANLEQHNKPLSAWQTYAYKQGDKLESIAKKSGITVAKLREINRLGPKSKISVGQLLLLPLKSGALASIPLKLPVERIASKAKKKRSVASRRTSSSKKVVTAKTSTPVKATSSASSKTKTSATTSKSAQLVDAKGSKVN